MEILSDETVEQILRARGEITSSAVLLYGSGKHLGGPGGPRAELTDTPCLPG